MSGSLLLIRRKPQIDQSIWIFNSDTCHDTNDKIKKVEECKDKDYQYHIKLKFCQFKDIKCSLQIWYNPQIYQTRTLYLVDMLFHKVNRSLD